MTESEDSSTEYTANQSTYMDWTLMDFTVDGRRSTVFRWKSHIMFSCPNTEQQQGEERWTDRASSVSGKEIHMQTVSSNISLLHTWTLGNTRKIGLGLAPRMSSFTHATNIRIWSACSVFIQGGNSLGESRGVATLQGWTAGHTLAIFHILYCQSQLNKNSHVSMIQSSIIHTLCLFYSNLFPEHSGASSD